MSLSEHRQRSPAESSGNQWSAQSLSRTSTAAYAPYIESPVLARSTPLTRTSTPVALAAGRPAACQRALPITCDQPYR